MAAKSIKLIAEIGINHDGNASMAGHLIESAATAGIWGVKFQYRNIENSYASNASEVGDEIVKDEIRRNYLPPAEISNLGRLAANLGLRVGISFFNASDAIDFSGEDFDFDFHKVPSVELQNSELVESFLRTGKQTFISTGAHTEAQIAATFERLNHVPNWVPLHCVSNYPARLQNARLGYIDHLKRVWKREVGYSSHDEHWEVCILAMQKGATVIERHITHDRLAPGLDHSTSSLPRDFALMAEFAENMSELLAGDSDRFPNQGELLNLQNLGRSYYAIRPLSAASILALGDVELRAPRVGLGAGELAPFHQTPLRRDVRKGDVVNRNVFVPSKPVEAETIDLARTLRLALPVRLHDLQAVRSSLPVGAYEFHLSFGEVLSGINAGVCDKNDRFSIHLPDYISSTTLIDPFATEPLQRSASRSIIDASSAFAQRLQDLTGVVVPMVGSFSICSGSRERYFDELAELVASYADRGVSLLPQWLPPIAWYFGGSVTLDVMNSDRDVPPILEHDIGICMDVCHLMMGDSHFDFDAVELMDHLGQTIRHLHIADTAGVDGEGVEIGHGDPENIDILRYALNLDLMKVVEVWQGHLNERAGFAKALTDIKELYLGA